jgi:hypothetical protein
MDGRLLRDYMQRNRLHVYSEVIVVVIIVFSRNSFAIGDGKIAFCMLCGLPQLSLLRGMSACGVRI